jgi:5-(carboxyamino)imidazole ribonucleotide synthase
MNKPAIAFPLQPGDWLGMLGGGQLGRMFCHAAQAMGYKVAVLDPDPQSPAGAVADMHIRAAYDDANGLGQLAARCRAVTTEFENVPAAVLQALEKESSVSPSSRAVAIVQDRIQEKAFLQQAGVALAPYAPILKADDLHAVADTLFPGILKLSRLGYDGKGQARVETRAQALQAFQEFNGAACVLEALQPLVSEISVVVARGQDGRAIAYPPAVNEHRDGILAISTVAQGERPGAFEPQAGAALPGAHARMPGPELAARATQTAMAIAEQLDYVGVLCVEFFVLEDGRLLANEIAPRPHNSGHYTMNACFSSQFEQQVRAMAGMPLGSVRALCPAVMLNILGDVWFDPEGVMREPDWASLLAIPGAKLHLYGKADARRGRKMGHVNVLGDTLREARQAAARAASVLNIPF